MPARARGRRRKVVKDGNEQDSASERSSGTLTIAGSPKALTAHEKLVKELLGQIVVILANYQDDSDNEDKYFDEMCALYLASDRAAFVEAFIDISYVPFSRGAEDLSEFIYQVMTDMDKSIPLSSEENNMSPVVRNQKGFRGRCLFWITQKMMDRNSDARARLVEAGRRIMNTFPRGLENEVGRRMMVKLVNAILNRLDDKIVDVRVEAVLTLCLLQDKNAPKKCPVTERLIFTMKGDASTNVRKTVIENVTFFKEDIKYLLSGVNDNRADIRASVYKALVKIQKTTFESSVRDSIITSGLDDTFEIVRKAASALVKAWFIKPSGWDVIEFLEGFDLVEQRNVIYKILCVIYNDVDEAYDKADWTMFTNKLIPLEELTAEKALYWRFMISKFVNTQFSGMVTPSIAPMCIYLKKFLEKVETTPNGSLILLYLMKLTSQIPLEEGGRYILLELLQELKVSKQLQPMHVKYLVLLYHQCAVLDSATEIMEFVKEIMNGVRENIEETPPVVVEEPEVVVDQHSAQAAEQLKLEAGVKMHERFELVKEKEMYEREGMADQVVSVQTKIDALDVRIYQLRAKVGLRASRITRERNDRIVDCVVNESNVYPPRALELGFCAIIVYLQTKGRLTGPIVNFAKEFSPQGLKSQSDQTRIRTFEMMTLVSMRYEAMSQGTMLAFVAALLYDDNSVKYTVTACFFDLACIYGFAHFTGEPWDKLLQKTRVLVEIMQNSNQKTPILVILEYLLKLNEPKIMKRTVAGICKLMLAGHLDSQSMLEKLLLLWLNPNNTFTTIYTDVCYFVDRFTKRGLKQAFMLVDCLIPCCKRVMTCAKDSPLADANIEKFIEFITHVSDMRSLKNVPDAYKVHVRLAINILNGMISVKSETQASQYALALKTINLIGLTAKEDKEIRQLITKTKAGVKTAQIKTSLDAFMRYLVKFEHPQEEEVSDSSFDTTIAGGAPPRPSGGRLSFRLVETPKPAVAGTSTGGWTTGGETSKRLRRANMRQSDSDDSTSTSASGDNDTGAVDAQSPDMFD